MESKKSIQLSEAFGAVLTLILVAILIIVAIVIFVSLSTSFAGAQTSTVDSNESVAIVASVGTIDASTQCGFASWSPTQVLNGTTFEELTITDEYTVDSAAGTITNVSLVVSPLLVTYTYTWGSGACDASEDMTTEFGNYTSLIGLVGTIIFLGLVIGILVAAFAFGGRRET